MVVSRGDPIVFTLQRPISLLLIAMIGLVLFYSARQQVWERRSKRAVESAAE